MPLPKPMGMVTLFRKQEEREVLYRLRVQEVLGDRLVLDMPLHAMGTPADITVGETVRIGYMIEHRAFYTFAAEVMEIAAGDVPQLIVTRPKPEQIHKVQRRNFFRVPVLVDGVLYPLPQVKGKKEQGVLVKLLDLSGGGFSFRTRHALFELGQVMRGVLVLPGVGEVNFEAIVRRLEPEEGASSSYLHGCEFKHFSEAGRNKVVKYCLTRQAKLLKIAPS